MDFVLRLVANGVAIWLTSLWVTGIEVTQVDTPAGQILVYAVVALVFGLVNAIIKPVVQILSIPFYIVTLGLFTLVVNALMLMLTGWITEFTRWGLSVDGFWTAVWGGLLISVISFVVDLVLPGTADRKRRERERRYS